MNRFCRNEPDLRRTIGPGNGAGQKTFIACYDSLLLQ